MNTINDVADYIILSANADDVTPLSNLKLQKLLYYAQAWSLGIRKEPFFCGSFQAWVHGPVNVDIFQRFKGIGKTLYSIITVRDVMNTDPTLSQSDKEFLDMILDNYMKYSGADLERFSHEDSPWKDARGQCGPWDRCTTEITEDSLRKFYGEKWDAIKA